MTKMVSRAFGRLLDLRAGELSLALKAFFVLFGIIAAHTLIETARDALFLGTLEASRLTLVYVALAALGLFVPAYTSRYVRRFGRRNALVSTLMTAAFGTTMLHFRPVSETMVYALYVWSGMLGTVLVIQFWMLAGQLFTVAQGKRLFAGITSGGVLGAVSGGLVATGMLHWLDGRGTAGVRDLLLVAAGLFLATAIVLTTIPSADLGRDVRPQRTTRPVTEALAVMREHPYVLRVAIIVALGTATVLATDYLFKFVAKESIAADALGGFFARYYAVLNSIALVVQLVLAQRVLKRIGVVGALLVLPFLLLLGGGALLLFGSALVLVLMTKGADGVLRHSLHRAASELLYLPLPSGVRDSSKSLVDAVFVRGAQALTGGVILLLATLGYQSPRLLAAGVLGLAVLWLLAALTLRSGYVDLFRKALSRGNMDTSLLDGRLTLDAVESVMVALSGREPARVKAAIQLLKSAGRLRLVPPLIFYHPETEVLVYALEELPLVEHEESLEHALRLRHHEQSAVRVAALRALGTACQADAIRELLDDEDVIVRTHAIFQLARCQGREAIEDEPAVTRLRTYAQSAPPAEQRVIRMAFSQALARDPSEQWREVLLAMPVDDDPEIARYQAIAISQVGGEEFIPRLLPLLTKRVPRTAAMDALVAIGPPALDALEDALFNSNNARLRRQIPLVIARFGSQRAADVLCRQLAEEGDGAVRYRVLRGLGRLVSQFAVKLDEELLVTRMEAALVEHLRHLALWQPFKDTPAPDRAAGSALLLEGLLEDKTRQALERASRLFHLLHPKEDVRSVFAALSSEDRRIRASAQEFLDALALVHSAHVRDLLQLVSDELSDGERVTRAIELLGEMPRTVAGALDTLLDDSDDALAAMAAYHALVLQEPAVVDKVQEVMSMRPSMEYVSEAAQQLRPADVEVLVG